MRWEYAGARITRRIRRQRSRMGGKQDRITLDLQDLREAMEQVYSDSIWQELTMPQKVRYIVKAFLGLVEPSELRPRPIVNNLKVVEMFVSLCDIHKLAVVSKIPIERLVELKEGKSTSPLTPDEATGLIRAGMDPEKLKPYFTKEKLTNGS